jgi:UMF1 family MFS transporter
LGQQPARRFAITGWVLFDWAYQPFFTLVTTFVFAPYFATHFVGNPVQGQALWGLGVAIAGLVVGLLSPVLGAIADASGRRKPWIAACCAATALGSSLLWFAAPGALWAVPFILAAFVVANVAAEFAIVFNNAMMLVLVPHSRLGRLSGIGWATGFAGGLLSLVLVLGLLAADPATGRTLIGLQPLFGLDPATHEGARITGPLSALWLVVFVLPLFLFTPDEPGRAPMREAARRGLRTLAATFAEVRRHAVLFRFLLANLAYANGLAALFALGGVYAAGVFGWTTVEIGVFAILLTVAAALGALAGGFLDDRVGSVRLVTVCLVVLLVTSSLLVSVDREHVLFVVPIPPGAERGLFARPAEQIYVALGLVLGAMIGPIQASSRTLLARLAPDDRVGQFFGLFAFSGKATSFLAPGAVAGVTAALASQRAGISVVLAFLLAGLALIATVRVPEAGSR